MTHHPPEAARPTPLLGAVAAVGLAQTSVGVALLHAAGYPAPRIVACGALGLLAVSGAALEVLVVRPRQLRAAESRDVAGEGASSEPLPWLPPLTATLMAGIVGAVEGAGGPLSALLFTVPLAHAAHGGWGRRFVTASVAAMMAVLVLLLVPDAWGGPQVPSPHRELLWALATIGVGVSVSVEILLLRRAFARESHNLQRMRDVVLQDHERRVSSLESIGARVAHEIKNPLTSIKALLSLEREDVASDDSRRRLEVIDGEVARIHRIVQDYLSYARPLGQLRPRRVDLRELVLHASEVLAGRLRQVGVEIVVSGSSAPLHGDPHQLRGVLLNLLSNAIEATPRGGTIGVETRLHEATVELRVRDTGHGMSSADLARMGTPYFTTRERGTGLGVVVAKAAIEQHGGQLTFESTVGVGTTVVVLLPLRTEAPPDPTASYDELVHPELAALVEDSRPAPASRREG